MLLPRELRDSGVRPSRARVPGVWRAALAGGIQHVARLDTFRAANPREPLHFDDIIKAGECITVLVLNFKNTMRKDSG